MSEIIFSHEFGTDVAKFYTPYATATVSLFGGQTLSFKPRDGEDLLFRPAEIDFLKGEDVHGGIPICWPWFGTCGEPGTGKHGFFRYSKLIHFSTHWGNESARLVLGLRSTPETETIWPYAFEAILTIALSDRLTLELEQTNVGDKPFAVTEGFHPYLRVSDRDNVTVAGVDGDPCVLATDGVPGVQRGDYTPVPDGSMVFTPHLDTHILRDPGLKREIHVKGTGTKKLVVWNPGAFKAGTLQNLGAEDYRHFLCVEPATLFRDAAVTIAPGETHTIRMELSTTPLT